jgi:hypothetical protein
MLLRRTGHGSRLGRDQVHAHAPTRGVSGCSTRAPRLPRPKISSYADIKRVPVSTHHLDYSKLHVMLASSF